MNASTNGAKGNRGVALDARPNRSGLAVPDVVHATLALATEGILPEQLWWVGTTPASGKRGGVCTLQRTLRRSHVAFYCSYNSYGWALAVLVARYNVDRSVSLLGFISMQVVSLLSTLRSIVNSMIFRSKHGVFV